MILSKLTLNSVESVRIYVIIYIVKFSKRGHKTMSTLKELQQEAHGMSILYVEDNPSLQKNATKLLEKFFSVVYVASDGAEGLKLFQQHRPHIVLTDIKIPHLDGMEMAKRIHHMAPDTKIIVLSAFDEKKYLYKAIELCLFRFLKKPVSLHDLSTVLHQAILQLEHERKVHLFQAQLGSIFNYQSSMIIMLKKGKPLIANQPLLDFYHVEDVEELNEKHKDIGERFLEHDGFLYNQPYQTWLEKILEDRSKIYNVKMEDDNGEMKHFILKCRDIPKKKDYGVLSFDDVTELNLLEIFDTKRSKQDKQIYNTKAMLDLLNVIQRNNAKISLHNYYKGISITNDAVIINVDEDFLELKTAYTQQKAIQYEQKTLITSEALPQPIVCDEVVKISFEKQSVELKGLHFVSTSPITRETIRIVPDATHQVTLFFGDTKYSGDLSIVDISLNAVKLRLSVLPAGLEIEDEVTIDMVFHNDKRPLIINTKAKFFRKRETKHSFELIFMLEMDVKVRTELVKYITKRQMSIIREFKGMQYGK